MGVYTLYTTHIYIYTYIIQSLSSNKCLKHQVCKWFHGPRSGTVFVARGWSANVLSFISWARHSTDTYTSIHVEVLLAQVIHRKSLLGVPFHQKPMTINCHNCLLHMQNNEFGGKSAFNAKLYEIYDRLVHRCRNYVPLFQETMIIPSIWHATHRPIIHRRKRKTMSLNTYRYSRH